MRRSYSLILCSPLFLPLTLRQFSFLSDYMWSRFSWPPQEIKSEKARCFFSCVSKLHEFIAQSDEWQRRSNGGRERTTCRWLKMERDCFGRGELALWLTYIAEPYPAACLYVLGSALYEGISTVIVLLSCMALLLCHEHYLFSSLSQIRELNQLKQGNSYFSSYLTSIFSCITIWPSIQGGQFMEEDTMEVQMRGRWPWGSIASTAIDPKA